MPITADKTGSDFGILVDSGVHLELDVVRMLVLGAQAILLGRPAVAARGQAGVGHLLDIIKNEMGIAMTLMGVSSTAASDRSHLCALLWKIHLTLNDVL